MPGIPKAQVKSRIILTPEHAKRLVAALNDNIAKYESVHGPIKNVEGRVVRFSDEFWRTYSTGLKIST